jgi:outer membrane protein TolC
MADTKIIVNCETGEVSEVELTAAEVKQREADAIAYAKAKADEEQAAAEKAEAKAAIAERLGLTDAELAILLA